MRTQTAELTALEDRQVPVQAKLAAAWAFLYIASYNQDTSHRCGEFRDSLAAPTALLRLNPTPADSSSQNGIMEPGLRITRDDNRCPCRRMVFDP